ncbi:mannose-1-phosphate guanylyltransferase/mannose-6-phosphate isomerase [Acinetobacter soli]|uniref:mannose-1-phosphate guanylyltransferase/mannose-6-phosphate isomerase n=1 Tax=Acinetobacter soli TaxID=487316 RepID=UPI00370CF84E
MNTLVKTKILENNLNKYQRTSIVPIILSGGAGTRLWPTSRNLRPKPFIHINKEGSTLFEKTLEQLEGLIFDKIITVTNEKLVYLSDEILKKHKNLCKKNEYLLEPFGRNTAAAISLAAQHVIKNVSPDAVMLVLSADHLIQDSASFKLALNSAIELAELDEIVTFGIKPTEPSTGFGYIQFDSNTYKVTAFKEKPNHTIAQEYIDKGYLWNAGIFCFKAKTILNEFENLNLNLHNNLIECYNHIFEKEKGKHIIPDAIFNKIEDISIDYAVMEKSNKISVVPCDIGWSDIGSWNAMSKLIISDKNNNSMTDNTIHVNSENVFVRNMATKRLITTIGLKDILIVDTPDALLVADKKCDQQVKELVNQVLKHDKEKVEFHRTVSRPWGSYTVLEESPFYKIKRISVKPGECLSLQMHHHRSEHWVVVSGVAKIVNGETETLVHPNESTYIPAGQKHRLTNPGVMDCILIEVQVGAYLGEDDIVRFTDVYGRN